MVDQWFEVEWFDVDSDWYSLGKRFDSEREADAVVRSGGFDGLKVRVVMVRMVREPLVIVTKTDTGMRADYGDGTSVELIT